MGIWYWLGVVLGLGVALGSAFSGLLAPVRAGVFLTAALAAAGGYGLGLVFLSPVPALCGVAGGIAGGVAFALLCRRTLTRGGTRGATAVILLLVAAVVAGLSFVPALGYLEAVAAALIGLRLRRSGGGRYAGLRTLARD